MDDREDEPHLLVVDDDARLRGLLRRYLAQQGFRVDVAGDAGEARAKMASITYDCLVLDVMMPGEDGLALTRSLRQSSRVPVLLLTAMDDPESRVHGLEVGADDYLAKPFEPRELVLRLRNILTRMSVPPAPEPPPSGLRFGEFRFDPVRAELLRGAAPVKLTGVETALLVALARRPGEPVSREDLAEEAQMSGSLRTVDVQMTRLRRKIEDDPRFPRYLQTVRGTGYVLKPD